ncbi:MAG: KR domain-containing protein, partial [Chloroflexi bacterium]
YFKTQLASVIKLPVEQIDTQAFLLDYGFDSIMAMRFIKVLEPFFGPLSKTLLFEYPTLRNVTTYFLHNYPEQLKRVLGIEDAPVTVIPQATQPQIGAWYDSYQTSSSRPHSSFHHRLAFLQKADLGPGLAAVPPVGDIAIIGVAGRYPGARDLHEFWENLRTGKDCITEIPAERWDHRLYFDADKDKPGTTYSKWGGFLDGVDEFDPRFFNISPRDAERMDPQERLFLECAFATLEDAGYTRDSWDRAGGSSGEYQSNGLGGNVGVFVGVMYEEYQLYGAQAQIQGQPVALVGNPSSVANRVSHFCNFHGPSMAVDTACSSSLTAIHLACQSIEQRQCELALAGGVNVSLHPNKYLFLGQSKFVSSQGRCESFGQGADGYVPAEGVGAVLLKPLAQAEADGDHIYGVIKATAINHGGRTNGYTVPNPQAQADVIKQALKKARIDPRTISYIEAHGTGTVLGDPIEIVGLTRAFAQGPQDRVAHGRSVAQGTQATQWCAIGSVKSNIGHAESASGIAGITKVLLQMRYGQLVPSLHAQVLNPHIDFSTTPFVVQQELNEWKRPQLLAVDEDTSSTATGRGAPSMVPRRAGVSSFGAGGSNAHVILEEYRAKHHKSAVLKRRPSLIVLSARTQGQLQERVHQLLSWIQEYNQGDQPTSAEEDLDNLAYTLQVGREAMEERLALQVSSLTELEEKLQRYLAEPQAGGDWYRGQVKRHDLIGTFAADEDGQKTLTAWMSKGKYEKLLEWWVKGLTIDWKLLYTREAEQVQGNATDPLLIPTVLTLPSRISLATYPFARERYWLPIPKVEPTGPTAEEIRTVVLTPGWQEEALAKRVSAASLRSSEQGRAPIKLLVLLCDFPGILASRIQAQIVGEGYCRSLLSSQAHRAQRFQDMVVQLIQELQHLRQSHPAEVTQEAGTSLTTVAPFLVQVVVAHREEPSLLEALLAVLKVAQQEYPKLRGQLIEVDGEPEVGALLAWLRENQHRPHEPHIRYRDGKRWVREWQEHPSATTPLKTPWKEGGCYLISGGSGSLARLFVQEIARHVQRATIILVGRSALSASQRAQLVGACVQGSSGGIRIDYQQVDVSDGPAVHALMQRVLMQYRHLNGIIHAAGVIRNTRVIDKTEGEVRAVLAPKVIGAELLDEASRAIALDFFLLCSSLSAVLGGTGYIDYAVANAYLDAFAYARQAQVLAGGRRGTTLSINWPYWEYGGMHVDVSTIQMMRELLGEEPMGTETGMETFYQALALGHAQVIVLHGQVERIKQQLLQRPDPAIGTTPVEIASNPDRQELGNKLHKALSHMVSQLLKVQIEQIDIEADLSEYGFDSVTFTQFASLLNQTYQLDLTPAHFYEYSTIERLAQYLQRTYAAILAPHFAVPVAPEVSPKYPFSDFTPPVVAEKGCHHWYEWMLPTGPRCAELMEQSPQRARLYQRNTPLALGLACLLRRPRH